MQTIQSKVHSEAADCLLGWSIIAIYNMNTLLQTTTLMDIVMR
jgi:hypothetical protein